MVDVNETTLPSIELWCDTVNINGEFYPPVPVDFAGGSGTFYIGANGDFQFTPAVDTIFKADRVEVYGTFQSNQSLSLKGKSTQQISNLIMDNNGIFILDFDNQETENFTTTSNMSVHNAELNGTSKWGKFSSNNRADDTATGFDIIILAADSSLTFLPDGDDFLVNNLQVSGTLEIFAPIVFRSLQVGIYLDILVEGILQNYNF